MTRLSFLWSTPANGFARACVAALVVLGCASATNKRARRLEDGSYELTCRVPLADCLSQAEERCKYHGYVVKVAREKRHRLDVPPANTEYVESAATIVCARPDALFDFGGKAADSAQPSPESNRTCQPGTTQHCVGPAGCRGGQRCLIDGSAFGECDCGSTPGAPSPTAPVPASSPVEAPPRDAPSSTGRDGAGGAPSLPPNTETPASPLSR